MHELAAVVIGVGSTLHEAACLEPGRRSPSTRHGPSPATSPSTGTEAVREPSSYVLLERYASHEALAAHRATSHFQEIVIGRLVPLLADRWIEEFEVPARRRVESG
jgi:hypothetical protein